MRILMTILLVAVVRSSNAGVISLVAPGETGATLALHCLEPATQSTAAVLFIHGASFPTMLAAGFEFEGKDSWMHFMANRGFLACGLDFLGFGDSSSPRAMLLDPIGALPVDDAAGAESQISVAVQYLLKTRGIQQLHIVAHSWGTIPAALYVAKHPATAQSLTLFGPIVPKSDSQVEATAISWWSISAQERYEQLRFLDVLPPGVHLLEAAVERKWAVEFANSKRGEKSKSIEEPLRIPAGPIADSNAATGGHYPYQPKDVRTSVFVVYGGDDAVVNDSQAEAFLARFTASPLKWRLRIDHGTHVMHLEQNRHSLYQSVLAFVETAGGYTRLSAAAVVNP